MAPLTASDGIHDTATTLDSIFIVTLLASAASTIACRAVGPKGADQRRMVGLAPPPGRMAAPSPSSAGSGSMVTMPDGVITVVLADDNLIVRAGVRALLAREPDVEVVGEAADHPELLAAAAEHQPQVVVSDIRMPPTFQREGIDAAKEIRQRNPGTGHRDPVPVRRPEYAVSLLADGAAGYSYLLKDRLAEGDQLIDAIRAVATGGTLLDPVIVDALVRPVQAGDDDLSDADQELLTFIAEGKPIKAIAVARQTTPEAVSDAVEHLFLELAKGASTGDDSALRRLRMLHQMIVDREEQGETLSRLLPGGLAEKLRAGGQAHRRVRGARGHRADVRHPQLLVDRRAHRAHPARRPAQRAPRRDERRHPRRGRHGDAVRRRRGDGGVRRPVPAGRPRRQGRGRRARDAPLAARAQPGVGGHATARSSCSASASPPARRPPPSSARRSASSTRSSATP